MRTVILPPAFAAPASYYAAMVGADCVVIDTAMRHDRRAKAVHRTVVDGAHGSVFLTVPVCKAEGPTWHDVRVSDHGRWWHVMQSTLATLYGPTPFFGYYRHDIFAPLDAPAVGCPVTDLDIAVDMAIRRLLGVTARMSVAADTRFGADRVVDLRKIDFFDVDMPSDLYPGRSVLQALMELGGEGLMARLGETEPPWLPD